MQATELSRQPGLSFARQPYAPLRLQDSIDVSIVKWCQAEAAPEVWSSLLLST